MTRACLALLACLTCASPAASQTSTGTLTGSVRDSSGAVMPGVAVTAKNVDTGVVRNVTTDPEGRYRIVNLDPGTYRRPRGDRRVPNGGQERCARDGRRDDRARHEHDGRPARRGGHGRDLAAAHRAEQDRSQPCRDRAGDRVAADCRAQLRGLREAVERRLARPRERRRRRVQGAGCRRGIRGGAAAVVWRPAGAEHADSGGRRGQHPDVHGAAAGHAVAGSGARVPRAQLDLSGGVRARARRLREHRDQVRHEPGQRLGVLLRHHGRAGGAVDPEPARRRRARPAPVRRHLRRADHAGPDVLLRQLRRPGA